MRGEIRRGAQIAVHNLAIQAHQRQISRLHAIVRHAARLDGNHAFRAVDAARIAERKERQSSPGQLEVRIEDLLALYEATWPEAAEETAYCRNLLRQTPEVLNPPPLITGDDLVALGLQPGPIFKTILERARASQLDGKINTKAEALALADQLK